MWMEEWLLLWNYPPVDAIKAFPTIHTRTGVTFVDVGLAYIVIVALGAVTQEAIHLVNTGATMTTWWTLTLIDIHLAMQTLGEESYSVRCQWWLPVSGVCVDRQCQMPVLTASVRHLCWLPVPWNQENSWEPCICSTCIAIFTLTAVSVDLVETCCTIMAGVTLTLIVVILAVGTWSQTQRQLTLSSTVTRHHMHISSAAFANRAKMKQLVFHSHFTYEFLHKDKEVERKEWTLGLTLKAPR